MKKVKFKQHGGKAVYLLLCAGLLMVGVASVAGYRIAVNSVTQGLITPKSEADIPDIDYSAVDAIVKDIEKEQSEAAALDFNAPPAEADVPLNPETPADEALVDLTDELETLYYEQAVMMPVNGEILTAFSGGELVKSSGGVWRTHDGIDIAAEEGADVRAMTSGTVTKIYDDPLWGCCVTVDHGNTLCGCYFGLSPALDVAVGDKLNAGDRIGAVGNTADIESDVASHLHFALKYENSWIDPISYIEPVK